MIPTNMNAKQLRSYIASLRQKYKEVMSQSAINEDGSFADWTKMQQLDGFVQAAEADYAKRFPSPSPEAIKLEVETGPLASDLASDWANVFPEHHKPEMKFRTGKLHPDAADAIRQKLAAGEPSRLDALGWGGLHYEDVVAAKEVQP